MIALDTNVLARFFAEDDPEQLAAADRLLATLTPEHPGFVCLTVMLELAWVLRRSCEMSNAQVLEIVDLMLRTRELEIEDGESVEEAVRDARAGADFADALIAATTRLYGCTETVTFDRKAADAFGWRLLA